MLWQMHRLSMMLSVMAKVLKLKLAIMSEYQNKNSFLLKLTLQIDQKKCLLLRKL